MAKITCPANPELLLDLSLPAVTPPAFSLDLHPGETYHFLIAQWGIAVGAVFYEPFLHPLPRKPDGLLSDSGVCLGPYVGLASPILFADFFL